MYGVSETVWWYVAGRKRKEEKRLEEVGVHELRKLTIGVEMVIFLRLWLVVLNLK